MTAPLALVSVSISSGVHDLEIETLDTIGAIETGLGKREGLLSRNRRFLLRILIRPVSKKPRLFRRRVGTE